MYWNLKLMTKWQKCVVIDIYMLFIGHELKMFIEYRTDGDIEQK